MSDLDLLKVVPSPIERGQQNFEWIMEHGTDFQKETVLIVLRAIAHLTPEAGDEAARSILRGLPATQNLVPPS
jgi:hypothetical protein